MIGAPRGKIIRLERELVGWEEQVFGVESRTWQLELTADEERQLNRAAERRNRTKTAVLAAIVRAGLRDAARK